ncbi:NUDIX hydrolase [Lacticaseibacillus chiayiensis]|uniref:NUDIX hydrolase n=1 Tax=Lacticaseibacillus chiayiensis TaxID=2100821 RepID=UPI003C756175
MADYIKQIRAKVGHTPLIMAGTIGILTDAAGRVLLQQRSDFSGEWGLISGTIEYGETPAQTMVREFKEETNLTVEVVSLLGVNGNLNLTYPNGDVAQWLCPVFRVEQLGGELNGDNDETEDLQFFEPNAAPHLFNRQHQEALAHFIAGETGYFD